MATLVRAARPLDAWYSAVLALLDAPQHRLANLILDISAPSDVEATDGLTLDRLLARSGKHTSERVAATIMPRSVERADDWEAAAVRLCKAGGPRSYFRRMTDYNDDGRVNQIARVISEFARPHVYVDPAPIIIERPSLSAAAHIGFPCLSSVQFHRCGLELSATATYRSHHYHSKAYGNLVGLSRLMALVARESGLQVGTLTVVSTDARLGNIRAIRSAVPFVRGAQ
jgi:hypothetical protein